MHAADGIEDQRTATYRCLFDTIDADALAAALRQELLAIEDAEARLQRFLADPRVERRVRADVRGRDRPGARRRLFEDITPTLRDAPGTRLPSTVEVGRYRTLADRLSDLRVPATAEDLAMLHGRLVGVPGAARFRPTPFEWRGAWAALAAPDPAEVVPAVEHVLERAQSDDLHPVLTALLFGAEMLVIRPFHDAVPSLGRLLMRLVLHERGLGVIGEVAVDTFWQLTEPSEMERLVQAMQHGDPAPWVAHAAALLRQDLQATAEDARFAAELVATANDRQWRLAQWFRRQAAAHPDLEWRFRDVHAAFPTVAPRTLKRDLATLRTWGILLMDGRLKSARYRFVRSTASGTRAGE